MSAKTVCATCGGCRVASLAWAGGNSWRREPCPDCEDRHLLDLEDWWQRGDEARRDEDEERRRE